MALAELRERIDELDRQLVALLERRMDVAQDIGTYKRERGMAVLDPDREAEKLRSIQTLCRPETGPLLAEVFQAVIAASRAYQARLMEEQDG